MENIKGGFAALSVIIIGIGLLFGEAAANWFLTLVIGVFEIIFNILTFVLSTFLIVL